MTIQPWKPIIDQIVLKHLGKLAEETGELSSAVARCIIQGLDGLEPTSGKINRRWLEEEIADVLACVDVTRDYLKLDDEFIERRVEEKKRKFASWHDMAETDTSQYVYDWND